MSFSIRSVDLPKLNTLTKYPSILTYHPLDPKQSRSRGKHEEAQPQVQFSGSVLVTEKIDGVNARIVITPDESYLLGSREELLYARGDLLHNPAMSIVETIRSIADRIVAKVCDSSAVVVCYGEVYGGKVTDGSRQYTAEQRLGFRVFDWVRIPNASELLARPAEQISAWREGGGQSFLPEAELQRLAEELELPATPRIREIDAEDMPQRIEDAFEFLEEMIPQSQAILDNKAGGRAEGIVVRTPDRSRIAKLRFKDYAELCKGKKKG